MDAATSGRGYMLPSQTVVWITPPRLKHAMNAHFGPFSSFDPAPYPRPAGFDGLTVSWPIDMPVYVNPPYGLELRNWVAKAYAESQRGARVVMLLPSRTGVAWFQHYATKGVVFFLAGRVHFLAPTPGGGVAKPQNGGATFDSLLLLFGYGPPHMATMVLPQD